MGWATLFVVDTSAIVAVILDEPEAEAFQAALTATHCRISAISVFEAETVIRGRRDHAAAERVRRLLALTRVAIVPFDDEQAVIASRAYEAFGKGFHRARLNMCDCAAYALAKSLNAPLLYKGDDFARTDIVSALT